MAEIGFQAIKNICADKKENSRRFFRAIHEFTIFLFSEYALSFNLNTETELYRDIRSSIQEKILPFSELKEKLKENDRVNELISLFPEENDFDIWQSFLKKCSWEVIEDTNIFIINEKRFMTTKMLLSLEKTEQGFFAYKYCYDEDDASCTFECFNVDRSPTDPIVIDNPFIFKKDSNYSVKEKVCTRTLDLDEHLFFELDSIKTADKDQREAICADTEQNIVVLAGAGSGKTRTLVSRLVYLHMVKKIPLERILLLTFTKNAADNMKLQAEKILTEIYNQLTGEVESPNVRAKTIDAFIYSLLKTNYQEAGLNAEPIFKFDGTSHTKAEYRDFIHNVICENNMQSIFERYYNDNQPNNNFRYLVSDLEKYACGMSVNYAGIERLLFEVINKQIETGTIYSFAYANYIVKEAIINTSSSMRDVIASRYDCILMDEFQDINILQNETFKPFYNTDMHFTFVGDDDQTIYSWRGSDNSIIKELVNNPNVKAYYLLTNYRNNPNVVKAGNVILNQISGRAKKGQPIKPKKEIGEKIRIAYYDEKYTNLANEVERLIQNGYEAEDISILSRNNEDKTNVTHALNAADIPVAKERIKINVNDNYKLLKAIISILNEYNIIASCREIKRIFNISEETDHIVNRVILGQEKPVDELRKAALLAEEIRNSNIDNLAKTVHLYSLKAGELFEYAVNDRHSDPVFESFELFCSNNSAPWPISARQLKEIFQSFEDNTRKENQSGGALDSGVKISTIHSSKGLEYRVVIITGLSAGKYPSTELLDNHYNVRCAQLYSLQASKEALKKLKLSVKDESFFEMVKECVNPAHDKFESNFLREFKEEIVCCSKKDIISLTAKGVDYFLDSYRYYVYPLEKSYIEKLSKLNKQMMMYKEQQEILSEKLSIAEDGKERVWLLKKDLALVNKKLASFDKKICKIKERYDRFENSIKTIKNHLEMCNSASYYIAEAVKADEIEELRKKLLEERERGVNEERRLFYVALTRAKDILYLCHERGAADSQFISIIPDELKEDYPILTKEDEREFNRLKVFMKTELEKEKVDNKGIDDATEKLISNDGFKEYIDKNYAKYIEENDVFKEIPSEAASFLKKAMGLLYIGEYADVDFTTEFAHNMQRMAESLLTYAAGEKALICKTDDIEVATKIADEIHNITKECFTSVLGVSYVVDLITKKNKFDNELQNLKSAGVFHYYIRSGKYNIPKDILCTWNKQTIPNDANDFLIAITDIANIRNILIHTNKRNFSENPVEKVLSCMKIIVRNCCFEQKGYISQPKAQNTQNKKVSRIALTTSDLAVGIKVEHIEYGVGSVTDITKRVVTVKFEIGRQKFFTLESAQKEFKIIK